jgi:hypothetical protein
VGSNPFESGLQLLMVKLRIKAGLSNRVYHFTTLSSKASQLVVVDVQPVHRKFIHFDVPSLMKKFEDYERVLIVYNGAELGYEDSPSTIQEWYLEEGMSEEVHLEFKDKAYGFLRGAMDSGVADGNIVGAIKVMLEEGLSDSRELSTEMQEQFGLSEDTAISIPYDLIEVLRDFNGADICGGGDNDCLREVELLAEGAGLRFNRLYQFVY